MRLLQPTWGMLVHKVEAPCICMSIAILLYVIGNIFIYVVHTVFFLQRLTRLTAVRAQICRDFSVLLPHDAPSLYLFGCKLLKEHTV